MRFVLVSVLIAWTCACVSGQDLADVTQTVGEGLGSLIGGEGFGEFNEGFQDALADFGGGNNNTQVPFPADIEDDSDDESDDFSPETIRQLFPDLPEVCEQYLALGQQCEEAKEGATSCPTICQDLYRNFPKECQDYFIEISEKFAGLLDSFDFVEDLDDDEEDDDVCADFLETLGGNINSPPGGTSPFPEPTTSIDPPPSNTPKPVTLPNTEEPKKDDNIAQTPTPTTGEDAGQTGDDEATPQTPTQTTEEGVDQGSSSTLSHIAAVAVAVFCANIMLIV